jgi:RHS repeat-associated protein
MASNEVNWGLDYSLYDPYGTLLGNYSDGSGNAVALTGPFDFGGQWGYYTDSETGLCLLENRYYDAGTGRFLNRDPIGYAGGENLYNAFGSNPVNEVDPSGDDIIDAKTALEDNRAAINSVAKQYGIQPDLLGGAVWVEAYAGGVPMWNKIERQGSVMRFVILGHGDLGFTKYKQIAADHPGLKSLVKRWEWAERRNADSPANNLEDLHESADMLRSLAARDYGSKFGDLTPYEIAIVLTEYNIGPKKPFTAHSRPSEHYGYKFLRSYSTVNGILAGANAFPAVNLGALATSTAP